MADNQNAVSGFRSAANILTLIGAILQTIICSIIIICTIGFGAVFAIPLIVLAWVAYNKTKDFSKGWNIYGIVQSVCLMDVVGLSGYILALVDLSDVERKQILYTDNNTYVNVNPVQNELNQVKAEIASLKIKINENEEGNRND